jgi:CheY-like chemotaxis protein
VTGRGPLSPDALAGIHVLVVDDDPSARELLRLVLEYSGAFVTVAASAEEALAVLARVTPGVLVSDIAMPERDGYWLLRELQGRPWGVRPVLPAVAITAYGETHGPDRTLPAGFHAHVRKPVDPWEFCRVVASLARKV